MKINTRLIALPVLILMLLLIFSATTDAAVAISGLEGFDPAVSVRRTNPQPTDSAQVLSTPTLAQSTTVGFAGHQWVVIGWNGGGVAPATNTATLLLANADTNKPADSVINTSANRVNTYAGSTLHNNITSFYNSLPSAEKGYIVPRNLSGNSGFISFTSSGEIIVTSFNTAAGGVNASQYITGHNVHSNNTFDWYAYHDLRTKNTGFIGSAKYTGTYHPDHVAGSTVSGLQLWTLSTAEASLLDETIREYNHEWWLRSPGNLNYTAALVLDYGAIYYLGHDVTITWSIRPAFNLNLSSLIFTSAAAGGKAGGAGINLSVAQPPTGAIKFTIVNNSLFSGWTCTNTAARSVKSGETVSISYSGAQTGANKFVSCVIVDNSGTVLFYGKLATTASGTANFIVPSEDSLPAGDYTIKLFNEECNGDYFSDFASTPVSIPMTVKAASLETFLVTFLDWDGTELATQTVKQGSSAVAPADPVREGYTFTGWDEDFSNITDDLYVMALYAINKYVVKFMNWDDTVFDEQIVEHGKAATDPGVPKSKTGYTFAGWGNSFNVVTKDMTINPMFDVNYYTVTFVDWNGTILKTMYVPYGITAAAPADPTREGHTFTGWAPDFSAVTNDLTVTAQYVINTYTVTFVDWNGAALKTETVNHGAGATAPTNPARTGYTFTGWSVDYSNITGNLTVTAQFEINKYTVKFVDWDGTVILEQIVDHGARATEPADPTRIGHLFTGWDLPYNSITRNITVTAEYIIRAYTVVFMADGSVFDSHKVNHGSAAVDPGTPTMIGYTFTGWDIDFTNITSNLKITAQFEISKYTVKFVNWNGTVLKEEIVEYGSNATAPADPARTNYTFTGWDVDFTNITSNLKITAQFEINTYIVKFVGYDGTVLKEESVNHGAGATEPAEPTRTGYSFIGWDLPYNNITRDLTVTAEYMIKTFTVIFMTDDSVISSQRVNHGSAAVDPGKPVKEGFTFTGWDVDFTNITRNLLVTAVFIEP